MSKYLLQNNETLSNRGEQWVDFASELLKHIEEYTVPQYGDYPNDQAMTWSAEDCTLAISKYSARFGTNSRPGQEKLDLMKIAHYACLATGKIDTFKEEKTVTITEKEYNYLLATKQKWEEEK